MMTPAQETLFLPFYQDILDMPEEGQSFWPAACLRIGILKMNGSRR